MPCCRRNWDPEDKQPLENQTLMELFPLYRDTWVELRGDEAGCTFDTVRSCMFTRFKSCCLPYDSNRT